MIVAEVSQTLECVVDAVAEIDRECGTLLNEIEHGLVNVKLEFRNQAIEQIGKKLTEERLIAWLVQKKLIKFGRQVHWESPYPGDRRRKCDLVIHISAGSRLWLELKIAWKAWFSCERGPTYSNSSYLPYLQGRHHTHSFRGDFEKLAGASIPGDDYRSVCLIGFDRALVSMNEEVAAVVEAACQANARWDRATERHWLDRRCRDFRINVWSWVWQPQKPPSEMPPALRTGGGNTL